MKNWAALLFFHFIASGIHAQQIADFSNPPLQAALFGGHFINSGLNQRDFTLSPKGDEIFYTMQSTRFVKSVIICRQMKNNKWQAPAIAPFSGQYRDLEAFFSSDGNTLYFTSDRPVDSNDKTNDFDIWKVQRKGDGWGAPVNLGKNVNTENGDEFYPSVARSGNIYFTTTPESGGVGKEDIVMCRFENAGYTERMVLDTAINTKGYEFNAFVDPDETFILFTCQQGRKDEMGGGDLYMSKKNAQQQWQPAVNLGKAVNSTALDYCPFVSWNKKILFFSSNRNLLANKKINSFGELSGSLAGPGNGFDDIYWIEFESYLK